MEVRIAMRLLYTITAYPPSIGGGQLHTHMLAQQMVLRQHVVQVIAQWNENRTDWLLGTTLRASQKECDYIIDGINVHRFGLSVAEKLCLLPWVLAYYPMMKLALPRIADVIATHLYPYAIRADLVHNIRIGREGLSYASYNIARRLDIPFVFTPLHHPRWTGWRYRAYVELYKMADAVIALTYAEKMNLIRLGVREERVFVTGIGPILGTQANPEEFLKKHNINGPMVLFMGQHYPYKGYQQVLQAAPLVWRKAPETHFVFIGPAVGRSEQIFKALRDQRIHRLGTVNLQEKTDALAACRVLCVPSTQESFGGVYTEAWSFGKPVIGCNIPAVAEVISDGRDGYLVNQDPWEIAERICYLLLHPGQAESMGKAGRLKVEERYTWNRIAELTEQVYYKVMT